MIKTIFGFTGYRVNYSKAWQAKQHAIELLWGDWKEVYNQLPRILSAMKHYNPWLSGILMWGALSPMWMVFRSMFYREFFGVLFSPRRPSSIVIP
jgi:hypothetical protein